MIVKLIGVAHKCGEYQGRQYDKIQLYFTNLVLLTNQQGKRS